MERDERAESLKERIVRCGGSHVGVTELADRVGTSRQMVRRMIRQLAAEGVMVAVLRSGARKTDQHSKRWNDLRRQERDAVEIELRRWKGGKDPSPPARRGHLSPSRRGEGGNTLCHLTSVKDHHEHL